MARDTLEAVIAEADDSYPRETGGVFLGYWSTLRADVVITDVVGPGPEAIHGTNGFVPDYAYQEQRIAELYQASGRRHTYLGDWHTHPDSSQTRLSWRDRQTLRRIASYTDAQSPTPVMAILAGAPDNWATKVWVARPRRYVNLTLGPKVTPLRLSVW